MTADPSAADVILGHLRAQRDQLLLRAVQVRAHDPVGVHRMRVATRQLRSAVTSFDGLLDRTVSRPLGGELAWIADLLGQARDPEVLRLRLLAELAAEPVGSLHAPPAPAEPTPGKPISGEPSPAEPNAAEPAPGEPSPAERAPGKPSPAEPAPGKPNAAEPTPAEPTTGAATASATVDAAAQITRELTERTHAAHRQLDVALRSKRYRALVSTLNRLVDDALVDPAAQGPAELVLKRPVRRRWKQFRREVRRSLSAERMNPLADDLWHDSRKAAKRLRYAAEALGPLFGGSAEAFGTRVQAVQQTLGDHQDSVTAREYLTQATPATPGVAFTFGRLHHLEQQHSEQALADFHRIWADLDNPDLRRWFARAH